MQLDFRQKALVFPYILIFLEIVVFLSTDMYLPALPSMVNELNITQDEAQYTLTVWFIGSISMQLILGPLSERYGRRLILLLGVGLFIITSFICSVTNNIQIFYIARFFQGTTVCAVLVTGYATIHELYAGKKVVQILAIISSITILAPALGPFAGALLLSYSNWHTIFGLLTVLAILGFVAVYIGMPENSYIKSDISSSDDKNFFSQTLEHYMAIFRNKNFMKLSIIECFVIICFFIWIVESPFIVINTYGKSEIYFGLMQLCVFSGFIAGSQTTKFFVTKIEAKKLCDFGLAITVSSVILFVVLSSFDFNIILIITTMIGISYGASMLSGLLNRLVIESSKEPMAQRVAVFSTFISLSAILGSYLVTLINDRTFDNIAYLMLGCVTIATITYKITRNLVELKN
ncbi:MAG: multidrug effflux MFS transporter [Gammaproteobacteria bacterium]|nr:multidrug effflux MFS transporter [Gammaproteobacteria bacterium]